MMQCVAGERIGGAAVAAWEARGPGARRGAAGVVVPPVLYVPVAEVAGDGSPTELTVEFRRTADGRTALLAYTALDRLVDGCGPHQPWALIPAQRLADIERHHPYELILLDVEVPAELRRTGGD